MTQPRRGTVRGAILAGIAALAFAFAVRAEPWAGPIFDAHLHYNDEAVARYPIEAVFDLLRRNGVGAILANSRPNEGTRALFEAARERAGAPRVVPLLRVYRTREDMATWFRDPAIERMVVEEEKRGIYRGVGEFHVHGKDADTPVVKAIVDFAVARGLVLLAHSDDEAIEILFRHNPRARVIWAHTGFGAPLERVEALLAKYPGLRGELSYRTGITEGGRLSKAWREMFIRHPGRFLVGSDTWTNARWETYAAIVSEYRKWLGELPSDIAEMIAWRNASELFRPPQGLW